MKKIRVQSVTYFLCIKTIIKNHTPDILKRMIKIASVKSIFTIAFVLVLCAVFVNSKPVEAQSIPEVQLQGYAWSENIGWISMSCKDGGESGEDICTTRSNYGVKINADRTVTGHAWSENIGWVQFGGLSEFPSGGGTVNDNAKVTGMYPNFTFTGWARACAATRGPINSESKDCSSMEVNTNSGGWDGWISLGGTQYSVSSNGTGMVSGSWAWGSDVIGWIDMSTDIRLVLPSANLIGSECPSPIPRGSGTCAGSVTWTISPATVANPSVQRLLPVSASPVSTALSGTNVAVELRPGINRFVVRSGTNEISNRLELSASCAIGDQYNSVSRLCEMIPNPPPTISLLITPAIIRSDELVNINWTIAGLLDGSCSVTGPEINQSGLTTTGSIQSAPIKNFSLFTLRCVGSYGIVETSSPVEVIPVTQEV